MLDNICSASTTNSHKSLKTKNDNINSNKYAIVAGNGPSLKEIDYARLPPPPPVVVIQTITMCFAAISFILKINIT
ncbi:hypothetical protein [Helicobacter bilis]|uniref:hypothetical protein n=1 Tax=Helicobacter bilis TaxID=37372 RepID=UPI00248E0353|nr:hypothetical protein [Helicobacter bilis]